MGRKHVVRRAMPRRYPRSRLRKRSWARGEISDDKLAAARAAAWDAARDAAWEEQIQMIMAVINET